MGVLGHDGRSKKRKIGNESLLEEHMSGDDTQIKKKRKKERDSLAMDSSTNTSVTDDASPKNKKKGKNPNMPSAEKEVDIDTKKEDSKLKKGKKRKNSLAAEESESVTKDAQSKTKKIDKDTEIGESKKEKKRKKSLTVEGVDDSVKENSHPKNEKKKKIKTEAVDEDDKDSQPKDEKKNKLDRLISRVLEYLHQWKNDVNNWKMSKYYQACLINFMNNPTIINEEDYKTCLEYLKNCRGNAKKRLTIKAMAWIKESEEPETKVNESDDGVEKEGKRHKKSKSDSKPRNDECTLFVKNLPYGQTKEDLRNGLMKMFPSAVDVRMPFTNSAKYVGFAFVEFSQLSDMKSALSGKQGAKLLGRPLLLDRVGIKNKSYKTDGDDKRKTLSPEFVEAEKLRRAQQVLKMFK